MQNMFPVRSNLGNARIPIEPDIDIESLVGNRIQLPMGNGLQRVSERMQPNPIGNGRHLPGQTVNPDLKFGGVVNGDSGPGRDILARSRDNAENLWQSYKEPQVTADQLMGRVGKPSRDEENYQKYLDNSLKTRTVDSTIAQNERKIGNEERRLDQADERINDSDYFRRQELERKLEADREKQKLADQKITDANEVKKNQRNAITSRAQAALDELNSLIDDKDVLTTRGRDAFGGINNMISNYWPLSSDSFDASTVRERLKNLLTLDLIGEMKSQSKTGATGFGALNLKELGVLEGGASRLTGKLSDKDAPNTLKEIRRQLKDILTEAPAGVERIRVRDKATGKTGTISSDKFNESKYERIQ